MKLKIPYWEGRFNVELYDMKRQALYLPNGGTNPSVTPATPFQRLLISMDLFNALVCGLLEVSAVLRGS